MQHEILKDILASNFITIFLNIGFTILVFTGNIFDKKIDRLFKIGIVCVYLLFLIDIGDTYFSHLESLNEWRYITSALGYTIRPIAIGIFISILLRNNKHIWYIWFPIIFEGIIAMTNQYTHLMFYLDENNGFHRGPLSFLPHILCILFMFLLVFLAIRRFRVIDIGEVLTILFVGAICIISVYFETVYSMKYLLTGAIGCSCIVYYTFLYSQTYKIDIMTGLFNRRTFYVDTEKKLNKSMAVIFIDLNELKLLNDNEGHLAGDDALITLSNILINISKNNYRVYRMGGDEFSVIGMNRTEKEIETFIKTAKNELATTRYRASFGSAIYSPNDDFVEVCAKADSSMYEDKKRYKNRSLGV